MRVMKRIFKYVRPYTWQFVVASVSLTILSLIGLLRPKLMQILIDDVIYGGEIGLLWWLSGGIVAISLVRGVFRYISRYLSEMVGVNSARDIRNDYVQKLTWLPYSYYDKTRTGELMSRVTSDVEAIRQFVGMGIVELYDCVLTFVAVFIILLLMNWQLTLITMISMPFLFWTVLRFDKSIRPTYLEIREQMAVVTSTVQENITGVRVIKAFNSQAHEKAKFAKENFRNKEKHLKAANIRAFYFPIMDALSGFSVLAIIWFGGYQAILGNLSVGEVAAFYGYIWYLIWPIRMLGFLVNFFEHALTAGERVFEVIDTRPAVRDKANPVMLSQMRGHVRFNNVHFDYGEHDVLKDINIDAPVGATIALVGETGSGKSSITNLICRFYDVTKGSVTIDGHDVRNLSLQQYRKGIGIVQQDVFLFSASIKENIAFGRPHATDEEIIAAAKAAQAHDFIMRMDDGYESLVGERGVGLSGGQKQRVAIARALLIDPKILIFDDATSSVDMETEFEIQSALQALMRGRTTFIIAHRISTIKNADQIIVLDHGRIVDRGTHDELIGRKGIYKDIYDVQYKAEVAEHLLAAEGGEL